VIKIKVAIVDDDLMFSQAVISAVVQTTDMEMCGSARDKSSGMELLKKAPADVLLVDLGLPDGTGLDVIRQARIAWPQCDIMVVTVFGDKKNVLAAIAAGALGYLLKDMSAKQIKSEIRTICAGGSAISPAIARALLSHLSEQSAQRVPPVKTAFEATTDIEADQLTAREYEVLSLANKGFTYEEVARTMGITLHTVKTHVKRSYTKLQVNSKTQAIYELQRLGKNLV
jgi:DNA-binding NarL/FixJ family response regulator